MTGNKLAISSQNPGDEVGPVTVNEARKLSRRAMEDGSQSSRKWPLNATGRMSGIQPKAYGRLWRMSDSVPSHSDFLVDRFLLFGLSSEGGKPAGFMSDFLPLPPPAQCAPSFTQAGA